MGWTADVVRSAWAEMNGVRKPLPALGQEVRVRGRTGRVVARNIYARAVEVSFGDGTGTVLLEAELEDIA